MNKKEIPQANIRRIRRISYLVLAVIVIVFCLLAAVLIPRAYWNSFTPEKWQTNPDRRSSMLEDMLEKHPLEGMTESEVTALLGATDNERSDAVKDDQTVYWLGDQQDGTESEWLLIDFENGVVTSYQKTTE